jgi:hypothetical protein
LDHLPTFLQRGRRHRGAQDPAVYPASARHGRRSGQTRVYYVAADKVRWDYAPQGRNLITGQQFDDQANVFVKTGPGRIGRV